MCRDSLATTGYSTLATAVLTTKRDSMTPVSADVENKVILITGGAQGIGGATARLCAQRGAEVIITDIKTDTGEALAASSAGGTAARPASFPWTCAATRTRSACSMKCRSATVGSMSLICSAGVLKGRAAAAGRLPGRTLRRGDGSERARHLPLRQGGAASAGGQRTGRGPARGIGGRRSGGQLFARLRDQQGRCQLGWA